MAQVGALDAPRHTQTMAWANAAEWEATCEAERRTFERMGMYEIMPYENPIDAIQCNLT